MQMSNPIRKSALALILTPLKWSAIVTMKAEEPLGEQATEAGRAVSDLALGKLILTEAVKGTLLSPVRCHACINHAG